LQRENI